MGLCGAYLNSVHAYEASVNKMTIEGQWMKGEVVLRRTDLACRRGYLHTIMLPKGGVQRRCTSIR